MNADYAVGKKVKSNLKSNLAKRELLLTLVLCCVVLSSFAQEESIEEASDATLDFDISFELDAPEDTTEDQQSVSEILWDNLRWSIGYQAGFELNSPYDMVSNRIDNRFRWESLIKEYLFISVDSKIIVRAGKDQQLDDDEDISAELRVRDFSGQFNLRNLSVKAGYQTVIWGEMDSIPVNDVMSPWDYSEFAFTAPEDARIGQPLIVGDLFFGNSSVSVVFNPYPHANRFPGGEAEGLLEFMLGTDNYSVDDDFPKPGRDYEAGIRSKHTIGPSDLAFYAAQVLSDFPRFDLLSIQNGTLFFDVSYPQYELVGVSANYGAGNFLWKAESAFKNNVYFPSQTAVFRDTLEFAVGADYNANGAYNLTIELHNQYIFSGKGELAGYKQNNSQAIARWSKNFLHETLSVIYYLSYQMQYSDMTHSAAVSYSLSDNWRMDLNATVFNIRNQDSPMIFIDDWDQISLRMTYDF